MDTKQRILLIEDDPHLAKLIQEYLQQYQYEVMLEARGDTAPDRIFREVPDLIILDLMLPGMDGLRICQIVRPEYWGPILILTAREDDIDHVAGLEIGADDYVKKPIEPRVLLARIRALLRRTATEEKKVDALHSLSKEDLIFGGLKICRTSYVVEHEGKEVELTTSEYELLCLLAEHPGIVLDRDRIFLELRGVPYDGLDRSVDINILRLRKKLEVDPSQPKRIKTIWGQGYLFVGDNW